MLRESTGRGAVEKPAARDGPAEDLLDGEAVDDGLERRAAADDRLRRRPVAAGLVIGDAEVLRVVPALDDVDGSAKREPPVDDDRIRDAALRASRPSSERPKLNSKYSGIQAPASGSFRTQTRRSRPIAAISSRHTRGIAGASSS
jgi:hypothetical protein